jgi:hypothetical protein
MKTYPRDSKLPKMSLVLIYETDTKIISVKTYFHFEKTYLSVILNQ